MVTLSVALFFLLMPVLASSELFNTRWLAWIRFFTMVPETADLVPMFPWFGVVLLGMVGMRLFEERSRRQLAEQRVTPKGHGAAGAVEPHHSISCISRYCSGHLAFRPVGEGTVQTTRSLNRAKRATLCLTDERRYSTRAAYFFWEADGYPAGAGAGVLGAGVEQCHKRQRRV